jgi:hypothetical protein
VTDADDDLTELRAEAERLALETAISMMKSEKTPATARVSAVRAVLGDVAQRRHDEDQSAEPHEMTAAQLQKAVLVAQARLSLDRGELIDVSAVEAAPARSASVFD